MRILVRTQEKFTDEQVRAIEEELNEDLRRLREKGVNGVASMPYRCERHFDYLYCDGVYIQPGVLGYRLDAGGDRGSAVRSHPYYRGTIRREYPTLSELLDVLPRVGVAARALERVKNPEAWSKVDPEVSRRLSELKKEREELERRMDSLMTRWRQLEEAMKSPEFELRNMREMLKAVEAELK